MESKSRDSKWFSRPLVSELTLAKHFLLHSHKRTCLVNVEQPGASRLVLAALTLGDFYMFMTNLLRNLRLFLTLSPVNKYLKRNEFLREISCRRKIK